MARVAKSILVLQRQLKAEHPRAAPPATAASSWGTFGDPQHDPTSDHSPKDFPGWGDDIVTAGDFPHAPALGLDFGKVAEALRGSWDWRIKYVIFNGRIFSSYAANGIPAWNWRVYSGSDRHDTHGHVSVVGDIRADNEQPWRTGTTPEENTLSEASDAMIEAMRTGMAKDWLGRDVSPVVWQIRAEGFQNEVRTAFTALKAANAAEVTRDAATTAAIVVIGDALNSVLRSGGSGTSFDTGAVITAVREEAEKTRKTLLSHAAREAAAVRAEADKLAESV